MKKIILILLFTAFNQNSINAQDPINVVITGDCANFSGTYTYVGLLYGKYSYQKDFFIDNESYHVEVGFDQTKWVIFANYDLEDIGYSNQSVPAGLLPPFTGWVGDQCTGTMTINQTLSTNSIDNFDKNLTVYPNPSSISINIENKTNTISLLEYDIVDLTGRIVIAGYVKPNEKINIENLQNGNYIIQIKNEYGEVSNKKFIKS